MIDPKPKTPPKQTDPFWKTKTMAEMSALEWESLCDGCGKCCLIRLEDEDTGKVYNTDAACRLFDGASCRCRDYANRKSIVPDCVILTSETVGKLSWLPMTCAYRLISEGKDLPDWHHLICGDRNAVHKAVMSVQDGTVSEEGLSEDDLITRITIWPGEPDYEE